MSSQKQTQTKQLGEPMKLTSGQVRFVSENIRLYYEKRRIRARKNNSRTVLTVLTVFVLTTSLVVMAGFHLSLKGESFPELPTGLIIGAFLLGLLIMLAIGFQRQCTRERAWTLTNAELRAKVELCMSEIERLPEVQADTRLLIDFLRDFRCDPDVALQKVHVSDSSVLTDLTFIRDVREEYYFVEQAA